MNYLNYCLDRAMWCIQYSSEPLISTTAWLKTVRDNLR